MNAHWPLVRLGEIARPVARPVQILTGQTYRTLGVKWWGEGACERATIDGSQTAANTLSLVREGDLIINKIWVRHGSAAVVSRDVDGCVGSGEFPTFELDQEKALPAWLHWLTKTPAFWSKCDHLSQGTSGKNRIKPELFLTIEIPLPPLAEQRRLVARIAEAAAKITEARTLREEVAAGATDLLRSIISHGGCHPTPMRELVSRRNLDVVVQQDEEYHFAGVYCFGRGVFSGQRKHGRDFAYKALSRLRAGDFTYPKLMAWEGAFGIVPDGCEGHVVSPEFPVFTVNRDCVLPEVLDVYYRTPSVWPQVAGDSTGTNVRRRRLNPADFLSFEFPLPSRASQEILAAAHAKVEELKRHQAETAAELEALLPAVLDRAFAGEL